MLARSRVTTVKSSRIRDAALIGPATATPYELILEGPAPRTGLPILPWHAAPGASSVSHVWKPPR
jgi:hypothetical protein